MNATNIVQSRPAVVARAPEGAASSRFQFVAAGPSDDAGLRRLLRENPMAGKISISLEREPDYFADAILPGQEKQMVIARENGRVLAAGGSMTRQLFVNGKPCRIGYIGGLRLDGSIAGRFEIMRRGQKLFHELERRHPPEFYFTSIATDNARARAIFERNAPGMPKTEFIGDFVTLFMPVPAARDRPAGEAEKIETAALIASLNEHNRNYQFAPCWSEKEFPALKSLGLNLEDFCFIKEGGRVIAGGALWDQRSFKQTVIRNYAPALQWTRPAVNLAAWLARRPGLPAVGATLAHATISHLTGDANRPDAIIELIFKLRARAAAKKIQYLSIGLAVADPRLAAIRARCKGREYHSRLYAVRWPETPGSAADLDGRMLQPELALL